MATTDSGVCSTLAVGVCGCVSCCVIHGDNVVVVVVEVDGYVGVLGWCWCVVIVVIQRPIFPSQLL